MINLLIYFVVVVILFSVAVFVVKRLVPAELQTYVMIALVVVGAVIVCYFLLGLANGHMRLPSLLLFR